MSREIKHSETRFINRSQINLNPYNPKKHSESAIDRQRKNIVSNGYMGGIVWNKQTGNLIDGHRRVLAHDAHYCYDGTSDYEIKVEAVDLTPKQEKEQMTYMAIGNTKADHSLIAAYILDIDYKNAGISDDEYRSIAQFTEITSDIEIESIDDFITMPKVEAKTEEQMAEAKAKIKEAKARQKSTIEAGHEDLRRSVVVSFSTRENLLYFLNNYGFTDETSIIKGEDFISAIEA